MFGQEITTARCSTGSKAEVLCPTLKAAEWSMAFAGQFPVREQFFEWISGMAYHVQLTC